MTVPDDRGVCVDQLYLEAHRATYTTQADVKRGNRRGEEALRAAELWSVAAGLADYPAAELDQAWKLLLLHQFHDIIPGSGIHWVNDDARRDHAAIAQPTATIIERAQRALAGDGDSLVVFNSASHHRTEVVELPSNSKPVLAVVSVPACGWAALDV